MFLDKQGNFVKAIVHNNYDATITGNGKTINERDTWTTFIYADGTSRDAGLTVHIQGPGGIAQLDAGQIVRDANGNVVYTWPASAAQRRDVLSCACSLAAQLHCCKIAGADLRLPSIRRLSAGRRKPGCLSNCLTMTPSETGQDRTLPHSR